MRKSDEVIDVIFDIGACARDVYTWPNLDECDTQEEAAMVPELTDWC